MAPLRTFALDPRASRSLSENDVPYHHTRDELVAFLNQKVAEQDWPAVSDAANDLSIFEILEARAVPVARPVEARAVSPGKIY